MSLQRLILPTNLGVLPVWIFGNNGGMEVMVVLPSGKIVIQSYDFPGNGNPNIYAAWGIGGKAFATTDPVIMPPGTTEGQAMAMLLSQVDRVVSGLLGTFISPDSMSGTLLLFGVVSGVDQYAALPASIAGIVVSGAEQLLVGGAFAYYYKNGGAHPVGNVAAIDMAAGIANALFLGLTITPNVVYAALKTPTKVFSDGDGLFGIHAIGVTLATSFFYSFPGIPSGAGTPVNAKLGATVITPPVASYGATAFSGPILLNADGSFASAFASARFALCPPAALGTGKFIQDSLVYRNSGDPAQTGASVTTSLSIQSVAGNVYTITATGLTTASAYQFAGEGGSAPGSFLLTFGVGTSITTAAAAILAAFKLLFPDCTITGAVGGTTLTMTMTLPAGATYYPIVGAGYKSFVAGIQTNFAPIYLALSSSDGAQNNYYLFDVPGFAFTPHPTNVSSAIAVNGGTICHVYGYEDLNSNLQWVITIPGVIRISVSLAYTPGTTHNGNISSSGDWATCPVSVVKFKNGFAIALPYRPVVAGVIVAPLQYTFSPGAAAAATTLLSGPVIVIDTAGSPDTAFDAAFNANFFSIARTDGVRFGPKGLAVKNANLYFGTFYDPTYIDLAGIVPAQQDTLGNIFPEPVWNPLTPPGPGLVIDFPQFPLLLPGLEVFRACDTTAASVRPTN